MSVYNVGIATNCDDITGLLEISSLAVPTLDGETNMTVPPGTQPDSVLRLQEKGVPRLGGRERGDLFLRLQVHVPEWLSLEEQELYERLQVLSYKEKR